MKKYNDELGTLELVIYYMGNVLTLGTWWFLKIIIKKAVNEASQDNK